MNEQTTITPKLLSILIRLSGIAGIGLALFALLAPLGVWAGFWDFRLGFSILRMAQPFVLWIIAFCAISAIAVFVVGRSKNLAGQGKMFGITLTSMFLAIIAWYIPNSYLPGEGATIPPIHDITTDLDNPPAFIAVMPLRGTESNTTDYGNWGNMTPERQAELQREAYPDITTQTFNESADVIFDRALAAAESQGWEIVAAVPEEGRIEATDTTFWFRFKDDVVIRIQESQGTTYLDARSTSRVGVSDVGKNAARLRAFFDAL